ncbi:hypothetical protein [Wenzhouxiangella limi]|uniref:Sensor domain-containing protein n=1 Tax=Wenzhouxiangella limi TaxID=2707351 RepID=A0A845UTE6_9GAMM|nr:hypothetical protein [Wenzhouxiangella limi]NDY95093.1 hypothetical protein [Wenzhouxiangella limi]
MNRTTTDSSLAARAARIAALAQTLVRRIRLLGWLGLVSAAWLWLVLFVILGSIPHFLLAVPAAVIGLILLLPGAVVLLTTLGLDSLGRLPQRLGAGSSAPPSAPAATRRGPVALLRKLWSIRREILGHRLALIRYAGAVRLFTLPLLLLISLAILACLFQVVVALVSLPLILLLVVL